VTGRLSYYLHDTPSSFRFKLAGPLAGDDVDELGQCWRTASSTLGSRAFVVDMVGVTGMDDAGRELLRQCGEQGAHFVARPAKAGSAPRGSFSWRWATLVPAVLLSLLLPVSVRAEVSTTQALPPKLVLARYAARLEAGGRQLDCRQVALAMGATAPKLARRGGLAALREVMARDLSAEAQAAVLTADSAPVSHANYRFHYLGAIGSPGALAYVFRIAPRRRRAGLIQGELWIDAASGLAIRKTGRLVKTPTVFARRIDMVQDIYILEEAPYLRITHLEVDTRLAGRAELTIRERICAEPPTIAAMQGRASDERVCSTAP
jgi:hypothetical protein